MNQQAELNSVSLYLYLSPTPCVCVCMCVKERDTDRIRDRDWEWIELCGMCVVYGHMYVQIYAPMLIRRGQRRITAVFLYSLYPSPSYPLETGSLTGFWTGWLVNNPALFLSLSPLPRFPQYWGYRCTQSHLAFYLGARNLNLNPHVVTHWAISLQPTIFILLCCLSYKDCIQVKSKTRVRVKNYFIKKI